MVVPPHDPAEPTAKAQWRAALRTARHDFVAGCDADARAAAIATLTERVLANLDRAALVAAYWPIDDEVDTGPLIAALGRVALPCMTTRQAAPVFRAWTTGEPLVRAPFGLRHPDADAPVVTPDVFLTPLLGFDASLTRLGHGAGYYDRAFAAVPAARRIGLAWSVQRAEHLPRDDWDVPLHAVATELDWIEPMNPPR